MPDCSARLAAMLQAPVPDRVGALITQVEEVTAGPARVVVEGLSVPYIDTGWQPVVGDQCILVFDGRYHVAYRPGGCVVTLLGSITPHPVILDVNADATIAYGQAVDGTVYSWDLTDPALPRSTMFTPGGTVQGGGLAVDKDTDVVWHGTQDNVAETITFHTDGSSLTTHAFSAIGRDGDFAWTPGNGIVYACGGDTFGFSTTLDELNVWDVASGGGISSLYSETISGAGRGFVAFGAVGTPNDGVYFALNETLPSRDWLAHYSSGGLSRVVEDEYFGSPFHVNASGDMRYWDEVGGGGRIIYEADLSIEDNDCNPIEDEPGSSESAAGVDAQWGTAVVSMKTGTGANLYTVRAP